MKYIQFYKTAIILGFGFAVGSDLYRTLIDFIYNVMGWPLG